VVEISGLWFSAAQGIVSSDGETVLEAALRCALLTAAGACRSWACVRLQAIVFFQNYVQNFALGGGKPFSIKFFCAFFTPDHTQLS